MSGGAADNLRARARELLEQNARGDVRAPEFGVDQTWWNVARPLTLANDLRGKVVLLDFWTSCCINCQHVLADLAWLEQRFAGQPFAVVGVHSAKFTAERDAQHVRQTVLREGLEHPVVVDREFDLWSRYAIRAWPTLVLVSPDGRVLGQLAGEGQRAVLEALIEAALELYRERGALNPRPLPLRPENDALLDQPLRFPGKLLAERDLGRLWIADSGHNRIVECELDGRFVRAFGSGEPGLVDGGASEARFRGPQGLALAHGALLVADTLNHALRRIDLASGVVSTLAGDGTQGYERAATLPAASARLNSPWDLLASEREVLIAMAGSHQVWAYDDESASLRPIAGDGAEARRDGPARSASLAQPSGLARWRERVLIADSESSSIRQLDRASAHVSTLAGGADDARNLFHFGDEDGAGHGRRFQHPLGVVIDAQDDDEHALAYIADTYNHRIKLLDPNTGAVTAYAGDGASGMRDGACEQAQFWSPGGLALCGDTLFVADTLNHAVRAIDLVAHEVRTLDLTSVPLPRAPRNEAALDERELPRWPGTLDHGPRKLRLPTLGGALEIALELRPGEQLAPGAPSQYRVRRLDGLAAARQVAGTLFEPTTRIELGVAGSGALDVQALLYVCDAAGACRVRSHSWRVDVVLDERAPARAARLLASLEA